MYTAQCTVFQKINILLVEATLFYIITICEDMNFNYDSREYIQQLTPFCRVSHMPCMRTCIHSWCTTMVVLTTVLGTKRNLLPPPYPVPHCSCLPITNSYGRRYITVLPRRTKMSSENPILIPRSSTRYFHQPQLDWRSFLRIRHFPRDYIGLEGLQEQFWNDTPLLPLLEVTPHFWQRNPDFTHIHRVLMSNFWECYYTPTVHGRFQRTFMYSRGTSVKPSKHLCTASDNSNWTTVRPSSGRCTWLSSSSNQPCSFYVVPRHLPITSPFRYVSYVRNYVAVGFVRMRTNPTST